MASWTVWMELEWRRRTQLFRWRAWGPEFREKKSLALLARSLRRFAARPRGNKYHLHAAICWATIQTLTATIPPSLSLCGDLEHVRIGARGGISARPANRHHEAHANDAITPNPPAAAHRPCRAPCVGHTSGRRQAETRRQRLRARTNEQQPGEAPAARNDLVASLVGRDAFSIPRPLRRNYVTAPPSVRTEAPSSVASLPRLGAHSLGKPGSKQLLPPRRRLEQNDHGRVRLLIGAVCNPALGRSLRNHRARIVLDDAHLEGLFAAKAEPGRLLHSPPNA
eukprot:scaffold30046_cov146-Isochrysis_galbana.AAC.2